MPHFSPIMWFTTGFLFYLTLFMFISVFWWTKNYMFPSISMTSNKVNLSKWNWS